MSDEREEIPVPEAGQADQETVALGTERELKVIINSDSGERPRQHNKA